MKKSLLLLFSVAFIGAQAQYFQRYYNQNTAGFIRNEIFTDGLRGNYNGTPPNNYVFLTTGYSEMDFGTPPNNPINIADRVRYVRANTNGVPLVNRGYHLFQNGSPNTIYHAHGRGICEEVGVNLGMRITGDVRDNPFTSATVPGGSDVLFAKIQLNGPMANQKRYDFGGGFDVGTDIKTSMAVPGSYIITGYSDFPLFSTFPILMRVNATGTPVWKKSYDLDPTINPSAHFYAQSVVEQPGTGNICVVGWWHDLQGPFNSAGLPVTRGFVFLTDPAGNLLWQMSYDAIGFNFDVRFRSVRTDAAGNFLIGGDYQDANIERMLGLNINPGGGINWITIPQKMLVAGTVTSSRCFDMIERINTSNQSEYYMSGPAYDFSGSYTAVTKCGPGGVPIADYYYATSMHIDDGFKIDTVGNGMYRPGFVVFSNTQVPLPTPNSSYMVKAYYDGHTCMPMIGATPIATVFPINPLPLNNLQTLHTGAVALGVSQFNVYAMFSICNSNTIAGASNAKLSGDEVFGEEEPMDETTDLEVYPNPVAASQQLTLSVDMETSGNFQLQVFDLQGRQVMGQDTYLNVGSNEMKMDVRELAVGAYILVLTNGSESMRARFIRQ